MPFKRNCRHSYKKRLLYKRSRLAATTYDNQALLEPRPTRSKGSVVAIESEDVAIVLGNSPQEMFLLQIFSQVQALALKINTQIALIHYCLALSLNDGSKINICSSYIYVNISLLLNNNSLTKSSEKLITSIFNDKRDLVTREVVRQCIQI